ncbi:MAG: BrnT family toxin [Pyrinomonadaceae bacterium]
MRRFFAGETVTDLDDRFDYGERRFLTLGLLKGKVVAITHTEIDEVVRLISLRKAFKNEEKIYFKEIRD